MKKIKVKTSGTSSPFHHSLVRDESRMACYMRKIVSILLSISIFIGMINMPVCAKSDYSRYIGEFYSRLYALDEDILFEGGAVLEILSIESGILTFNLTSISTPPGNRFAGIKNIAAEITDDPEIFTFNFRNDGWGNSGVGTIYLNKYDVSISVVITEAVNGAMWNIGMENKLFMEDMPPQIIEVVLDGQEITFGAPPIVENSLTLVPVREIFEALGSSLIWEADTQSITSSKSKIKLSMQIGSNVMTKFAASGTANDMTKIILSAAPKLVNDRTYVPLRAISEGFGATVEWDEAEYRVIITTLE